MFLDHAKIFLKSGNGGNGVAHFRHEKYVPRGGPDGGDGGRGGHIIFLVNKDLSTLSDFRYQHHFKAEHGAQGEGGQCSGKDGADRFISIPAGTIIKNADTGQIIADLTEPGTKFIALRGGRGGRGNTHFATPTRQTPDFAEKGELSQELWVELELKLLADVGLIGFPNAGKSTLISKISAARPKIADYPFTTLIPNLGVVDYKGSSFVAVDIPGLIEGAHKGIGLGDQFLRHIERTRMLVHLVDLSGVSGRGPYQDYLQISNELQQFNPALAQKPQIVVATKMDLPEAQTALADFKQQMAGVEIIPISAATGAGIDQLLNWLIQKLAEIPKELSQFIPEEAETKAENFEIKVHKEGALFEINNEALIKRMARFDLGNDDSIRSLQKLLKQWGVEKALIDAGVKEGDSVKIGEFEFTYFSEE